MGQVWGASSECSPSFIYFFPPPLEIVRQVPQGPGAAPREESPLLPPAGSWTAVGEPRPWKLRR